MGNGTHSASACISYSRPTRSWPCHLVVYSLSARTARNGYSCPGATAPISSSTRIYSRPTLSRPPAALSTLKALALPASIAVSLSVSRSGRLATGRNRRLSVTAFLFSGGRLTRRCARLAFSFSVFCLSRGLCRGLHMRGPRLVIALPYRAALRGHWTGQLRRGYVADCSWGLPALRGGGRTLFFFVSVAVDGDSWRAGARGSAWPTPRPTARSALAG